MSTAEILTIVFAAVAAVSGIAAIVIALMKRSASGGAFDGRALREEQKRDKEDIIHEVDFVRKAISESNTQSNTAVTNMLGAYLDSAEKKTNGLIEYMGKAMQQLAQAEKENADKTDEVVGKNLEAVKTEFKTGVADMRGDLGKQFTEIRQELAQQVDRMRGEMRERLSEVRADNEKQLEKMRATVDEKLSETLNTRIQAAFQQVSERLDSVQKGFGEMRELTSSVGNLNRIFSNVKTRGNWGEVSLQSLLEQILAPEQYKTQFYVTPRSREAVDFAIVMPGQAGEEVYLPIDAKFPLEDYYRLLDASDDGDKAAVELARKALRDRVKSEARSINEKYIKVPRTTNFAVLYVPNEGLYAEILRDGSFASDLQTQYRVTVCGPTTISALLNSLQVGFTTLRIQKKSGEIIKLMQAVRTDFARFTGLIDKIKKQAQTVVNTVEDIDNRNRILTKKLDKLGDDMPEGYVEGEAAASLDAPPAGEEE
ncbi:MAG TPA: DNA recombination protein RmuC [Candidatus Limadaptatus stercoravium]|nr:DNA recombination protein RmuC [Candidatus Limadaptatus stercoravium]